MVAFKVGLQPEEALTMTLWAFLLCVRGYHKRRREDQELAAWHLAYSLNVWSKRKVTPEQLLGTEQAAPVFLTKEAFDAHMRARIAAAEAKAAAEAEADAQEESNG